MKTNSLLEAIRVVKENERTAAEFYDHAAKTTGSQVGKELFEQLAKFEKFHFVRISDLEKSLQEKSDFIKYEGKEFPLPPALGPKAVEEPHHQTVMNIISEAIGLEKKAEQAYADLAVEISDPQGHAMFKKLSEEEHFHYRLLNEAYWNLTNFKTWKW